MLYQVLHASSISEIPSHGNRSNSSKHRPPRAGATRVALETRRSGSCHPHGVASTIVLNRGQSPGSVNTLAVPDTVWYRGCPPQSFSSTDPEVFTVWSADTTSRFRRNGRASTACLIHGHVNGAHPASRRADDWQAVETTQRFLSPGPAIEDCDWLKAA